MKSGVLIPKEGRLDTGKAKAEGGLKESLREELMREIGFEGPLEFS